MDNVENVAVLTGDIVASTSLSAQELDRVREVLGQACQQLACWSEGLVPRPVEFSRGDEWQLLLSEPAQALRASLWIRSALLSRCGVDTRVSVGIGPILPLASTLSQSGGAAFICSGQELNELSQLRLSVVLAFPSPLASWISTVCRLCDTLVGSWTRRQAELVHAALAPEGLTQSAIAAALSPPVSKQAVGKGLRAAHWDAIAQAVRVFELTQWSLLGFEAEKTQ